MRVCQDFTAKFDDPNLVSCAGLGPILQLAARAGLQDLVAASPASFSFCTRCAPRTSATASTKAGSRRSCPTRYRQRYLHALGSADDTALEAFRRTRDRHIRTRAEPNPPQYDPPSL